MNTPNRVYGIDLGTTYSCIAYANEHGEAVVVDNTEGQKTTPSVVYFESEGNVVVGEAAKSVANLYPEQCVSLVKRSMGKDVKLTFFRREYTPQEISSQILRKVAQDAASITGDPVRDVVITCPAYFDQTAREATKQAGEIAGFNVHSVVQEPIAAAIAYGMDTTEDQTILIYDLGGGTFDLALVAVSAGEIRVIATGGDHHLGGYNWDDIIASYYGSEFAQNTGGNAEKLRDDPEAENDLLRDVEQDKKRLSSSKTVERRITFEGNSARISLTREKFDDLTQHLLDRTIDLTRDVLETGRTKGFSNVDKLLLVGGSTFMPQVRERLERDFGIPIALNDPNLAVAKGAAIYGQKYLLGGLVIDTLKAMGHAVEEPGQVPEAVREEALQTAAKDAGIALPTAKMLTGTKITTLTTRSFGVLVYMPAEDIYLVSNLIVVDDPLPTTATGEFSTVEESQTETIIQVYQSIQRNRPSDDPFDPRLCEPDEPIGEAVLQFARPVPINSPIEITIQLDRDGLLRLRGRDLTTGGMVHAEFRAKGLLDAEELAAATRRSGAIMVS